MLNTALYLTRPQDVHAHLIFAAMEIGEAVLSVQGRQIYGVLGAPDPESSRVPFTVDPLLEELVEMPEPGRAVRVSYEYRDSAYAFFSEIEGAGFGGPRGWVLQLPRTVERTDRRLVSRYEVTGEPGFSLELDLGEGWSSYALMDISSAGMAFFFEAGQGGAFMTGRRFDARIVIDRQPPIAVELEIRNTRPRPGGGGQIAGGSLVRLGPIERSQISRQLSEWRRKKRGGGR
jgi:hypothetical protein